MTKIQKNIDSLEGQKWAFEQMNRTTGTGRGNSWTFLSKNRFTATNWYSDGGYWTQHYSGKYYYNKTNKTVFIKSDKTKNPILKIAMKQQLNLKISESDTLVVITNGWNKPKEITPQINVPHLFSDKVIEKWKFETEQMTDEK